MAGHIFTAGDSKNKTYRCHNYDLVTAILMDYVFTKYI